MQLANISPHSFDYLVANITVQVFFCLQLAIAHPNNRVLVHYRRAFAFQVVAKGFTFRLAGVSRTFLCKLQQCKPFRVKQGFLAPLREDRIGSYRIRVCT